MTSTDELERLLAEATPGPWGYDTLVFVDGQALLTHTDRLGVLTIPDAALICAAVNALPELVERVKRLEAALDPDETKYAYMGEFKNENGSYVSWTTIKEIMAAIKARAALNQEGGQ